MDENYLWIGDSASLFYVLFIRFWFLGFDLWDCVVCFVCFFFFFLFSGLGVWFIVSETSLSEWLFYCIPIFLFFDPVHIFVIFWLWKLCGLYILWCKEKGFPLFLFMDLVLLYFRSQCVCVCFFLISRLVFLDLGLYFCSIHTYISIYVIFNF